MTFAAVFLLAALKIIGAGDAFMVQSFPKDYAVDARLNGWIRSGDARVVNFEVTVNDGTCAPAAWSGGTWASMDPSVLPDFLSFGFNGCGCANNHSVDFTYDGLRLTEKSLRAAKMPFTGIGETLQDATRAAFIDTPEGRVAILSVTAAFHPDALAGWKTSRSPGRPGVNGLRFKETLLVTDEQMREVRAIADATGVNGNAELDKRTGFAKPEAPGTFAFGKIAFKVADKPGRTSVCDKNDLKRITEAIRAARSQAAAVVVLAHSHTMRFKDVEEPAPYFVEFCHAAIDAGADAVFGGGTHQLKGIEFREGKPIFYSLGDFVFQNSVVPVVPPDFCEKYGVPIDSDAKTALNARSKGGKVGLHTLRENFLSVVPKLEIENGRVTHVTMLPIELHFGREWSVNGLPRTADARAARDIASALARLSAPFGTKVVLDEDGLLTAEPPQALPSVTQRVRTVWKDARAAADATAELTMLGPGEKVVFSGRWDDRNPRALPLARALAPTGLRSTFYVCGSSSPDYTKIIREEVSLGNSIGCHTIHHDYMYRMLPVKSFREILQNRIELEIDSQTPVVTLGMPYGQSAAGSPVIGFNNVRIVGRAAANAGLLGGAESEGRSAVAFGLSDYEWAGSFTFRANDKNPDRKLFAEGFGRGTNLVAQGQAPWGPHVTLGVHPWQTDAGLVNLAAMVREAVAAPGVVLMNENEYVAARLGFLRSKVRKIGAEGNVATFEITRPASWALGASVPLNLRLSDGRTLKVCPGSDDAVPRVFARVEGTWTVSEDESEFGFAFVNTNRVAVENLTCTLRLPPGYEPGVVTKRLASVAAGEKVRLVFKAQPPKDPLFRSGPLYVALEIDSPGRRGWAVLEKDRECGRHQPCPRDCARLLGPSLLSEMKLDLASLSSLSAPLDGAWGRADDFSEGDAPWAVTAAPKGKLGSLKRWVGWKSKPGEEKGYALAFDFEADTAAHGAEWEIVFVGGHVKSQNVRAGLNGKLIRHPFGRQVLRSGRNRLVIELVNLDADMLWTALAVRSAKDGAHARFIAGSETK